MKTLGTALVLAIALVLASCGSGTHSDNVNGTWNAALTPSSQGGYAMQMNVTISSSGTGTIAGTNMTISGDTYNCLSNPGTASGTFGTTAGASGSVEMFTFGFRTNDSSNPVGLNLVGQLNNGKVTGNWTMSGVSLYCNMSGTFTMNSVPAPYLPKH